MLDDHGRAVGTCLLTNVVRRATVLPHVRAHVNTDGETPQDSVVIEHNQLLALPGAEEAVAASLAAYVNHTRIDEFRMAGATAPQVPLLRSAFGDWVADVEWKDSPYVDLDHVRSLGVPYLQSLSRNSREQIRRSMARYEQRGSITLTPAQSSEEAVDMLHELTALHEQRWHALGQAGGFASELRKQFHTRFVMSGFARGNVDLVRVAVGGMTIGVLYNLVANGTVCFYQSGFQYEDDKLLKPGLVVHTLAIQHYMETGFREYDLLPSGPTGDRYKRSLAKQCHQLAVVTLSRPGWRAGYFSLLRRIKMYL